MPPQPPCDEAAAHRHFSVKCFNAAWELIDQAERSAAEDRQMLLLAHASLWHWTQREDCTPQNLSIGYWQTSRVYALVGQAESARTYGHMCLEVSQDQGPFYLGYACEALARAESIAGHAEQAAQHIAQAREAAQQVQSAEDRKLLLDDLETIS